MPRSADEMVGRTSELDMLVTSLRRASEGIPQVGLVLGEAGIGKTRLLREVARSAGDEATLVRANVVDLSGDAPPYWTVSELLRSLVREVGIPAVTDVLGSRIQLLAPLVPHLDAQWPKGGGSVDRFGVYAATQDLLIELTRSRTLVLVVEDLHWADETSLDLLLFWAATIETGRLGLLLSSRDTGGISEQLQQIRRLPNTTTMTLEAFDAPAVAAQALQLDPDLDRLALAGIAALTQGIPLFVEEVVTGHGDLTELLRVDLAGRITDLDSETQHLLRVAALEPRPFEAGILAAVGDRLPDRVNGSLDRAAEAGLVESTAAGRWQFHHELLRRAVADTLPPARRATTHTRWAEALTKTSSGGTADLAAIAMHHRAAGPSRSAFLSSLVAAKASNAVAGTSETFHQWREALAVINAAPGCATPEEHSEALADTLMVGSSWPEQLAVVEADEALPSPVADGRRTLHRVFHVCAEAVLGAAQPDPADVDELRAVRAELRDSQPSCLAFAISHYLLYAFQLLGLKQDRNDSVELVETLAPAMPSHLANARHWAFEWRQVSLDGPGELDERIARGRLSPNLESGRGATSRAAGLTSLADDLLAHGELQEAVATARESLVLIPSDGGVTWRQAMMVEVDALYRLGRWDEVDSLATRLTAVDPRTGAHLVGDIFRFLVALNRGDAPGAQVVLDAVRSRRLHGDDLIAATLRNFLGLAQALTHEQTLDSAAALKHIIPVLNSKQLAVMYVPFDALTCAARLAAQAPDVITPAAVATIHHRTDELAIQPGIDQAWRSEIESHLARAAGTDTPAVWLRAVNAWDGMGVRFQAAQCRLHAARAALASDDRSLASLALGHALDAAQDLRAHPLEAQIRSLAGRARLQLPGAKGVVSAHEGLTAREHEVLQLLAQGMTNEQIGKALFMSPRTASVHVSHILTKLGASNRTEVAGLAHRRGLIDTQPD